MNIKMGSRTGYRQQRVRPNRIRPARRNTAERTSRFIRARGPGKLRKAGVAFLVGLAGVTTPLIQGCGIFGGQGSTDVEPGGSKFPVNSDLALFPPPTTRISQSEFMARFAQAVEILDRANTASKEELRSVLDLIFRKPSPTSPDPVELPEQDPRLPVPETPDPLPIDLDQNPIGNNGSTPAPNAGPAPTPGDVGLRTGGGGFESPNPVVINWKSNVAAQVQANGSRQFLNGPEDFVTQMVAVPYGEIREDVRLWADNLMVRLAGNSTTQWAARGDVEGYNIASGILDGLALVADLAAKRGKVERAAIQEDFQFGKAPNRYLEILLGNQLKLFANSTFEQENLGANAAIIEATANEVLSQASSGTILGATNAVLGASGVLRELPADPNVNGDFARIAQSADDIARTAAQIDGG
jgi:hypothetical protein